MLFREYSHTRVRIEIYKMTSRDHPEYSIIKIGQNAKKSPEDLRRFVVTENQVKLL